MTTSGSRRRRAASEVACGQRILDFKLYAGCTFAGFCMSARLGNTEPKRQWGGVEFLGECLWCENEQAETWNGNMCHGSRAAACER